MNPLLKKRFEKRIQITLERLGYLSLDGIIQVQSKHNKNKHIKTNKKLIIKKVGENKNKSKSNLKNFKN